jgi:integrase
MRKVLQQAERELAGKGTAGTTEDPLMREAAEWREAITSAEDVARGTGLPSDRAMVEGTRAYIVETIVPRIEADHGPAKARDFAGIATGSATPIALHHETFLEEQAEAREAKTLGDHRRALKRLVAFANKAGYPATLEAFSERRTAGLFVSHLITSGTHHKTGQKLLSMLSTYWRWLIQRGRIAGKDDPERDNPWLGHALPKSSKGGPTGEDSKRAFTDDEVRTVLYTPTPETKGQPLLVDFMRIAALSGMRIDEIASLRTEDIRLEPGPKAKGWPMETSVPSFRIADAKTPAGWRVVPIHSGLLSLIQSRLAKVDRRLSVSWLFPELPEPRDGSLTSRSDAMGKRFGRHRIRLGVHEKPEGQRQSNVDFHSFRRWFANRAERAGVQPHVISRVIGHEEGRKGMTLSVYSKEGPSEDQLRQCVEAVRLPRE